MKRVKTYFKISVLCMTIVIAVSACKVEDPWVDAAAAPVLVDIVGAPFGYPQEKDPAVSYLATSTKLKISARLLELDKSGILNKAIGIDSIPVAGVKVSITMRTGAVLGEATSGADGMVSIEKTWAELGVTAPSKSSLAKISWSGSYKGIAFTRFSQITGK